MRVPALVAALLAAGAACTWCRPPPRSMLRRLHGVVEPTQARSGFRYLAASGAGRLRSGGKREVVARRLATIELCAAVADELRAGRLPAEALLRGLAAWDAEVRGSSTARPFAGHAAAAARSGRPVAAALMRDAEPPGAEGLRLLAACWDVAEQHGSALAAAADRVAGTLRAQELARRRIELELAAPRATARMLAGLPLLGLFIGSLAGADPVGVLVGTPVGLLLLVTGIGLDLAGLAWVHRIARAAERTV